MTSPGLSPVRIQLPPLHRGQVDIAQSETRFKVIVCGRRFGKTTYGVWECARGALEDPGVYWWVGPNYPSISASGAWKLLKDLLRPIEGVVIREADREVVLPNGAEIWIKSADNPDTLRGSKLKGVVLDEFAQIRETTWVDVLRPALTDYKGWAIFIGTPKGKNWAYRLFEGAKNRLDWKSWRKPTTDNPFIDPEEVEDARLDMSDESFAQEYLADFGASQYLVLPEVMPEIHEWRWPVPEFISYHGGMDFGGDTIGAHFSATAIAGRTERDELIIFNAFKEAGANIAERQLNWTMEQHDKIDRLRKLSRLRTVSPPTYRADRSQMVAIQFMSRFGIRVFPTKGGPDSVEEGIELLHRRFKVRPNPYYKPEDDKGDVPEYELIPGKRKQAPKLYVLKGCPYVLNDLMGYRYPEPVDDDRPQKKNPLKVNDDMADAVRYLVEGVDRDVIGDPHKIFGPTLPRLR